MKRRTAQVLRVGPSGVSAREDRDAFWIYVPLDDIVLVIVDGPAAAAFAHHVNIWIDSRDYFGSKALIEAVEAWPVEKRLPITRALA